MSALCNFPRNACPLGCHPERSEGPAFSKYVLGLVVLLALTATSCGYRLAGRSATGLPPSLRTVAILPFQNDTLTFQIEQLLTAAVTHEFLSRTSYRIQSRPEGSDAVLHGVVASIYSSPTVFDPSSGRTTEVMLTVSVRATLSDTRTGETLYEADGFVFREPYEVSTDPAVYFGENQPALERLSRRVAADFVSTVLENF